MQVVVKTYKGKKDQATLDFQNDAQRMAQQGYRPTSQNWAPGSWGCMAFLIAALLCFVVIGIIVFIYMLLVKPEGMLPVTYELGAETPDTQLRCPDCAKLVLMQAKVCKHCGCRLKPAA